MKLWRELSKQEELECRNWARKNYKPLEDIKGTWHPATQEECRKINEEWNTLNS